MKKFLNLMAQGGQNTAPYYEWEYDNAKRIKIVSYTSNSYLKRVIDKGLGSNKHGAIRPKNCFHNALLACFAWSKIEYVEGYISISGIPLEHSWNRWNGIDFDLTQEILQQRKVPHYEILSLDGNQVRFWASELGTTGPYRQDYYYTHVSNPPIIRKKRKTA